MFIVIKADSIRFLSISCVIIMNKRTVVEIPRQLGVTKLWSEGQLRSLVLTSLTLQIVLVLLGSRRKYLPGKLLRFILSLAYSLANPIAEACISIISNCQGEEDNPSQQIRAFWAPFLLLHLGGSDTITAYSLEDHELWTRHLVGLFMQSVWAFSALGMFWKGTPLNFLTIPMFVAGLIKYGERTCFLKSISHHYFRKTVIPPPDPGHSYEGLTGKGLSFDILMANYEFYKSSGYDLHNVIEPEMMKKPSPAPRNEIIPDAALLQEANKFFPKLKRLFTDHVLLSKDLDETKRSFLVKSWTEAFRVIEIELGFVHDMLYTKAMMASRKWGVLRRSICLFSMILTFMFFLFIDRHEYSTTDVIITLCLLVGAIVLEIYSIILLSSSDWTMCWLSEQGKTRVSLICQAISSCRLPFLFPANKRWSDSMAQQSLISCCLKNMPIKFSEIWKFFCICPKLEECSSKNSNVVPKYLKTLIFKQLQKKSRRARDIKEVKKVCDDRGKRTLEKRKYFYTPHRSIEEAEFKSILRSIEEAEFDESILLWHLATDICYYTDLNKNSSIENSNCKASKLLSDYMVYLLVKRPLMLPDGLGQNRFQDSCAEATAVLQRGKHVKDRIQACKKLLLLNTDFSPSVKANESMSMLFRGSALAKSLQSLEYERKWKMISHVWIEILCYAACHCPRNEHAKELTQGGELLTHVWLLMAHFGITKHVHVLKPSGKVMLVKQEC
ncbi:uncharacterized protein LOC117915296 [Vitis riparia]|uniref:uncharacterized protein LOC117915296 n=1 Tax=Vitis riparia TaxID=96939 RepID=UPI00155AAC01|nr:uncharacterized protein LOC117915296 [Vitis riparia]